MIHKLLLTSLISFVGFCNPVFAGPSDDNHIHIEQVGGAGDDLSISATQQGYGNTCLLYTSPSPRDGLLSRMPSSA